MKQLIRLLSSGCVSMKQLQLIDVLCNVTVALWSLLPIIHLWHLIENFFSDYVIENSWYWKFTALIVTQISHFGNVCW